MLAPLQSLQWVSPQPRFCSFNWRKMIMSLSCSKKKKLQSFKLSVNSFQKNLIVADLYLYPQGLVLRPIPFFSPPSVSDWNSCAHQPVNSFCRFHVIHQSRKYRTTTCKNLHRRLMKLLPAGDVTAFFFPNIKRRLFPSTPPLVRSGPFLSSVGHPSVPDSQPRSFEQTGCHKPSRSGYWCWWEAGEADPGTAEEEGEERETDEL